MNAGQQIELVFNRIAAPYYELSSFDELPTPFRCIAVDLLSREEVVLASGSLSLAMRATMAIPGLFTPVEMGDQLLVDGGTLNNVPADVARDMGADIVIAVNVSATAERPTAPRNVFDVLGQTIDTMMVASVNRALDAAELVVTPDLRGLSGLDWNQSDELADRGYAAAEAMRDELLRYAVDDATYAAWQDQRSMRRRVASPVVRFVRVEGVPDDDFSRRIQSRFASELVGKRFDPAAVDEQVLLLTGTDRFSVVRYRLEKNETETGLVVTGILKSYGPPFLLPAVDLQNIDASSFALDLRTRLVMLDTPFAASEIRVDGVFGTRLQASGELFARLGHSPFFVAPRAYWTRRRVNAFDAEDTLIAELRETTAGLGVDVGVELGHRSQLRFGYDWANFDVRRRIGESTLPEAEGDNRLLSLRWTFDAQTRPFIPTGGVYIQTTAAHYLDTPDLIFDDVQLDGPTDFDQAEVQFSAFHSTSHDHRLFIAASGGTSFGDDAGYNAFELGGLLRLGAFNIGELRGDNYVLALGGGLLRVLSLPEVLGGNGYLGAWVETGSAFDRWDDSRIETHASGGFVLETILGPAFVGGSVSLNDGSGRFYIGLGTFLR
jgi:NTE family protein